MIGKDTKPIKFCVWDKINKEMCHVITISYDKDVIGSVAVRTPRGTLHYVDGEDAVLLQFTGLCDKNGKEIYEGDILNETVPGGTMITEVTWGSWGLFASLQNRFSECEIIGNIYENKELLGGKK